MGLQYFGQYILNMIENIKYGVTVKFNQFNTDVTKVTVYSQYDNFSNQM